MNNYVFGINNNTPTIGFCISKNLGIYIANQFIIGFEKGKNVVVMITINQSYIIYKHLDNVLNFNIIANTIIDKLIESLRYNGARNIDIDEIIKEVNKIECSTIETNK